MIVKTLSEVRVELMVTGQNVTSAVGQSIIHAQITWSFPFLAEKLPTWVNIDPFAHSLALNMKDF
jgi:hypothetical protein